MCIRFPAFDGDGQGATGDNGKAHGAIARLGSGRTSPIVDYLWVTRKKIQESYCCRAQKD